MTEPLVLWRWWIVDERTGKRRLTQYHMSEKDALEQYPRPSASRALGKERLDPGGAPPIVTKT